jgi:hypothetical protein
MYLVRLYSCSSYSYLKCQIPCTGTVKCNAQNVSPCDPDGLRDCKVDTRGLANRFACALPHLVRACGRHSRHGNCRRYCTATGTPGPAAGRRPPAVGRAVASQGGGRKDGRRRRGAFAPEQPCRVGRVGRRGCARAPAVRTQATGKAEDRGKADGRYHAHVAGRCGAPTRGRAAAATGGTTDDGRCWCDASAAVAGVPARAAATVSTAHQAYRGADGTLLCEGIALAAWGAADSDQSRLPRRTCRDARCRGPPQPGSCTA